MTTSTKYVIDNFVMPNAMGSDVVYPQLARIILVDGLEVSRGYPDFKEVAAADPDVIPVFLAAVRDYLRKVADILDAEGTLSTQVYLEMIGLRTMSQDFTIKYDQSSQEPVEYI